MRLKEYEIVIEPREIIFEHIEANKLFRRTLNIKNVGNKSRRMELFRPSNKAFTLKFKNPDAPVPPGMEIAAIIEFETKYAQDFSDKLVVSIDNKEIDIPIQAFPAKPILTIDDVVDFKVCSADNKTISSQLRIKNSGAVDGKFSINYTGHLPIKFFPSHDIVPAYSEAFIRVDFFTNAPRKVDEKISITLQGAKEPGVFRILASIMQKQLVLFSADPNRQGEQIKKIDFGSCYYGCNLTSVAILYNASPEKVDYVVLLEEKGVGAEIGAELSKSTNALKAKDKEYKEEDFSPLSKLVSAFPNNGTLEPFERRPIFFRFSPQFGNPKHGFSTTLKPPPRRDYAIFLYFEMLGNHERTELAITGTALPVLLRIEPNKLDFGSCEIGQKKDMSAVLYNDSELKDVKFKFRKVANYTVQPASGRIQPRSCRNVIISFIPHQMGNFSYIFNCEVIDKIADKNNPLLVFDRGITEVPIQLTGQATTITTVAVPKFSGAMDPLLTNEVGLNVNTSFADLKSFAPKGVVQNAPNDRLHRVANSEKLKQKDAYKVAFPNDLAKSVGPFNRNEKYK